MDRFALAPEQVALCAAQGNPFSQDLSYRSMQAYQLVRSQGGGRTTRINPGGPQAFICVPVPQPGKDPLIQEHSLEHAAAATQLARQHSDVEAWIQRLRTQGIEIKLLCQQIGRRDGCPRISKLVDEAQ